MVKEQVVIQFTDEGLSNIEKQLTNLQKKMVMFRKSYATAMANGNKSTAKAFATKIRSLGADIGETSFNYKQYNKKLMGINKISELAAKSEIRWNKYSTNLNKNINDGYLKAKLNNQSRIDKISELAAKSEVRWNKYNAKLKENINKGYEKAFKNVDKSVNKINKSFRRMNMRALQSSLSFMFFGMAVKRMFTNIIRSSFMTFNKFNADTDLANNATNRLTAQFSLLKYTVGDAFDTMLTSIEPALTTLIQGVTDFVEQHPKLVSLSVTLGVIVSAIMLMAGQIALFAIGVKALEMGSLIKKFTALNKVINELSFANILASMKNINFTKFFAGINKGIKGLISSFTTGIGGIITLALILYSIFGLLTNNKRVVEFFANALKMLTKLIFYISWGVQEIGKALFIIFKNAWISIINYIIKSVNRIIRLANKIPGVSIQTIGLIEHKMTNQDFFKNHFFKDNADSWKSRMNWSAEYIGASFTIGIEKLTTALGTNMNKSVEKQNLAADKQLVASENIKEAAELMKGLTTGNSNITGLVPQGFDTVLTPNIFT